MEKMVSNVNKVADSLVTLGRLSSYNPSELSTTTISSMASHIQLLKYNNVDTKEAILSDTNRVLDNLRTRKNNKLSNAYKLQICATLKRLFPNELIVDKTRYQTNNKFGPTCVSNPNFMYQLKKITEFATQIVIDASDENDEIKDTSIYDTAIAILLTVCTSLHISEIRQLKMEHIESIRDGKPIFIHQKSHTKRTKRIITMTSLLEALFNNIERNRPKFEKTVRKMAHVHNIKSKFKLLQEDYIIVTSISHLTRKLKEIVASSKNVIVTNKNGENSEIRGFGNESDDQCSNRVGFNSFRKYVTSILINSGSLKLAQLLNRHTSQDTTYNHYYINNSNTTSKVYDKMLEKYDNNEMDQNEQDEEQDQHQQQQIKTTEKKTKKLTRRPKEKSKMLRQKPKSIETIEESMETDDDNDQLVIDENQPNTTNVEVESEKKKTNISYPKVDNYSLPPTPMTPF